ncbi:MAG: 50S ribosomal protein L17 [Patescibacteria group bacterium]|nr:50S ribosomal protein L17 [Patescibacteria group bacterium]MDD5121388.1 50S ribosomal protein L17 [Patescibacteria group bacterium]MDD5221795.1 50S ribosomal protein L17 [Patescibacteria group bacterium]MDD5395693.1 50S ribosomal protein L17 [Patescibacteria group bacterium]
MRHRKNKKTLDRKSSPHRALLRGLAINFILAEKIKTTEVKAKTVKSLAERLVTMAKKNDLSSRRKILSYLNNQTATKKLLETLGPRYNSRPGGYTRVVKLKQRKGDAAKVAVLEFI